MKVLIVNGSPHSDSTTKRAINEVLMVFDKNNVVYDLLELPSDLEACRACEACGTLGKCVIDDPVSATDMNDYDGLIVASPVHYANPSGEILNYLNRLFYSNSRKVFNLKPAAAIAVARRAGTLTAFDSLNHYFGINGMSVIGSTYWNNVFGNGKEEAECDLEGLRVMRNLANNFVYYLKMRELANKNGLNEPEIEKGPATSFIR